MTVFMQCAKSFFGRCFIIVWLVVSEIDKIQTIKERLQTDIFAVALLFLGVLESLYAR